MFVADVPRYKQVQRGPLFWTNNITTTRLPQNSNQRILSASLGGLTWLN